MVEVSLESALSWNDDVELLKGESVLRVAFQEAYECETEIDGVGRRDDTVRPLHVFDCSCSQGAG